jgi:hypothetical protein
MFQEINVNEPELRIDVDSRVKSSFVSLAFSPGVGARKFRRRKGMP